MRDRVRPVHGDHVPGLVPLYPVWYRGRRSAERQAAINAVVVWCVAAVICVPPLLGWKDAANGNYKYDSINDVHECVLFQTRGYVIYSASGSFFVPLVVTLFFYASIFVVIHSRMRKTKAARAGSAKKKTTSMTTASAHNDEVRQPEASKSEPTTAVTTLNVDVEMSSLAASSNVELCTGEAAQENRTKTDIEPIPEPAMTDEDQKESDASEKTRLMVPTIVVKMDSDSEPSRTLIADADENGCPSRFGMLSAEPDPDTISIRSFSMNRRLSFLAIKNTAVRMQRSLDQREMRATIRMAIIIAFFCGFWLGFFVVYVIHGCCPNCHVPRELDAFFFWLGYSNSSVNPILYTIFNEEFRRAFLRILGYKSAGVRKR